MQIQVSTSYTFIYAARDLFLDLFIYFFTFLQSLLSPSGSVAAVLGLKSERTKISLMYLNPWRMKTMTQRLCMLWLALKESSSGWGTASTFPLRLLISGEC